MENENLKSVLLPIAPRCQQTLVNQDVLCAILARDADGISPASQRTAQEMIDHNKKLRELLKDVVGMIARIS